MDALREQARNALLEGAQSGKLMEAGKSTNLAWFKVLFVKSNSRELSFVYSCRCFHFWGDPRTSLWCAAVWLFLVDVLLHVASVHWAGCVFCCRAVLPAFVVCCKLFSMPALLWLARCFSARCFS